MTKLRRHSTDKPIDAQPQPNILLAVRMVEPRPILLQDVLPFVAVSVVIGFFSALQMLRGGRMRLSTFAHALSMLFLVVVMGLLLDSEVDEAMLRAFLGVEEGRNTSTIASRRAWRSGWLWWVPFCTVVATAGALGHHVWSSAGGTAAMVGNKAFERRMHLAKVTALELMHSAAGILAAVVMRCNARLAGSAVAPSTGHRSMALRVIACPAFFAFIFVASAASVWLKGILHALNGAEYGGGGGGDVGGDGGLGFSASSGIGAGRAHSYSGESEGWMAEQARAKEQRLQYARQKAKHRAAQQQQQAQQAQQAQQQQQQQQQQHGGQQQQPFQYQQQQQHASKSQAVARATSLAKTALHHRAGGRHRPSLDLRHNNNASTPRPSHASSIGGMSLGTPSPMSHESSPHPHVQQHGSGVPVARVQSLSRGPGDVSHLISSDSGDDDDSHHGKASAANANGAWVEAWDESGQPYLYNEASGETRWASDVNMHLAQASGGGTAATAHSPSPRQRLPFSHDSPHTHTPIAATQDRQKWE